MGLPAEREQLYSYADLLSWSEDGRRYELYEGELVALAAPSVAHQRISGALFSRLYNFLEGKPCEVFASPLDVRLLESEGDSEDSVDTVVQPDLLVVCDGKKVDRRGVHGAPDLIIEILSESTHERDWVAKKTLYERAGVREYWIVDPAARFAAVHRLTDGAYPPPDFYTAKAQIPVSLWDGFSVDLSGVFPEIG